MTDTAERIRVGKGILALALVLLPIPASSAEPQLWVERTAFHAKLNDLVEIGTDGALLGAAVDLFDFALAGKGWRFVLAFSEDGTEWCAGLFMNGKKTNVCTGPTAAAALLAAMEDL